MKKLLSIVAIIGVVAVCAAPKTASSLSACLWHYVGGTLTADTSPSSAENLLDVKNSGSSVFSLSPQGTVSIGKSTLGYWGSTPSYGETLLHFNDVQAGDPDNFQITTSSLNGSALGEFNAYGNSWSAFTALTARDENFNYMRWTSYATAQHADLFLQGTGGIVYFSASQDGVKAGGSEYWKLGSVVPSTVTLNTNKFVQVQIGGQIVKLAVVE